MSPPELAADGPVAFFGEPIEVAFGVARGKNLHAIGSHGLHGHLSESRFLPWFAGATHSHPVTRIIALAYPSGYRVLSPVPCLLSPIPHFYEPLIGEIRLDGRFAAVGVGELDFAVFDVAEEAELIEVGDNT